MPEATRGRPSPKGRPRGGCAGTMALARSPAMRAVSKGQAARRLRRRNRAVPAAPLPKPPRQTPLPAPRSGPRRAPGAGRPSGTSLADELEKISKLKEDGVLTDGEFPRMKSRLIDKS